MNFLNIMGKLKKSSCKQIEIEIDRDSVCMGDDCLPHNKNIVISSDMKTSEMLQYLAEYVPQMNNVAWVVHADDGVCGYIFTDDIGNSTIEVYGDDGS